MLQPREKLKYNTFTLLVNFYISKSYKNIMIKNIIKIDYNNLFKIKIVQIKTFKIEIESYLQYIQKIKNMHKHTCNIYIYIYN